MKLWRFLVISKGIVMSRHTTTTCARINASGVGVIHELRRPASNVALGERVTSLRKRGLL